MGGAIAFIRRAAALPWSSEYQLAIAVGAGLALGLLVAGGGVQ